MAQPQTRTLSEATPEIYNGDLLLWRGGSGLFCRIIRVAGRSQYYHAAVAAWWGGDLMAIETTDQHGGRAVWLERLVAESPGEIEVHRANLTDQQRETVVREMRRKTARPYGWWTLLLASLRHLPIVRFFVGALTDDGANGSDGFCSAAVAAAYRAAGDDPVPNLADSATEPGDLARSRMFEYLFTLIPDEKEALA